jgi:hypothetical protein
MRRTIPSPKLELKDLKGTASWTLSPTRLFLKNGSDSGRYLRLPGYRNTETELLILLSILGIDIGTLVLLSPDGVALHSGAGSPRLGIAEQY